MSERGLSKLVRRMRFLVEGQRADTSDAQLIERFVKDRDETAFAKLVQRHGPMVQGVCRRELQNVADAEDAFQATFLVFARKAGSLHQRERVASWLHGVAHRIARKARVVSVRRRSVQMDFRDVPGPEQVQDLAWRELQLVLDEEVERLPAKYREPVVLCYLEGMTYAAAAGSLGVPAGTISGRLDRAREVLRNRLMRRGLTLSAGLLGTLLTQHTATAALAPELVRATVVAALTFTGQAAGVVSGQTLILANATLRSLFYTRCQLVAGILLASAVVLGGGFWSQHLLLGQGAQPSLAAQDPDAHKHRPGPASPGALRLVERAIQALGGRDKAVALRTVSWTTVWDPEEATERQHRITAHGHDQVRTEMEFRIKGQVETSLYVMNKDVAWRRDANGSVAVVTATTLASNQEHFYALRLGDLLACPETATSSLTQTPDTTIDQRTVTGLRVERTGYPAVQLYFDKATGLLHRSETLLSPRPDGTQSTLVYTFEDYRPSAGLPRFTRVTSQVDQQPRAIGHIRDFQILNQPDERLFARP